MEHITQIVMDRSYNYGDDRDPIRAISKVKGGVLNIGGDPPLPEQQCQLSAVITLHAKSSDVSLYKIFKH